MDIQINRVLTQLLKNVFLRKLSLDSIIVFLVLGLIYPLNYRHDTLRLVLLNIVLVIILLRLKSLKDTVKLHGINLIYISFSLCTLTSYLWAYSVSFIWIPVFINILLSILLLSSSYLVELISKSKLTYLVGTIYFGHIFLSLSYFLISGNDYSNYWFDTFGQNSNTSLLIFVIVSPYLNLWGNTKFLKFLKFLTYLCCIIVLIQLEIRGVLVILIFTLIMQYFRLNNIFLLSLCISVALMLMFFFVFSFNIFDIWGDSIRYYQIESSFHLFKEHFPFGVGAGNWGIALNNVPYQNSVLSNWFFEPMNYKSHCLFSTLIAEYGLFAFLPLSFFLIVLLFGFYSFNTLNKLQRASLISFLCFILSSFLYTSTVFHPNYFSSINLIGFLGCGYCSSFLFNKYYKLKVNYLVVCALLVLMPIIWIISNDHFFNKEISSKSGSSSITKIENLYNPYFFTHSLRGESLALNLALLYSYKSDSENAIFYFEKALKETNDDLKVVMSFCDYLISNNLDLMRVENMLNRQALNYPTYHKLIELQFDLHILKVNPIIARKFFKKYKQYNNSYYMGRIDKNKILEMANRLNKISI